MDFKVTLDVVFLGLTALISLLIAIVAWERRSTPASRPFMLMMIAVSAYAGVAALEAGSITLFQKIFWSTLEYVCSGSVITLFFIFAVTFARQTTWLTGHKLILLWLPAMISVLLVSTNHWHRWVWTDFLSGPSGSNMIIYQHGWGFFSIMGWAYTYGLLSSAVLIKAALSSSVIHRHQAAMLLLGGGMPVVGSLVYMLKLIPTGLNVTPMSFMLTGLIYVATLFRFRLLDMVPIARDLLVERMNDGVIFLDAKHRIVDINPAAQKLLQTTTVCVGQRIDRLLPTEAIASLCATEDFKLDLTLIQTQVSHAELQVTVLRDRTQQLLGKLLVLRDVTQQKQAALNLQAANQQLQNQLLEIQALQNELKEQAIRDSLTGLFNRRYFEETLPHELSRARRKGYPISILLIDIDYFKKINDTFGHGGGDCILKVLADLFRNSIRSGDIACRYGGEEFVVVLPGMSLKEAYKRAEKIRLSFQGLQTRYENHVILATLSGGIAVFPADGATSHNLLSKADQALYRAKAEGRNQIRAIEVLQSQFLS